MNTPAAQSGTEHIAAVYGLFSGPIDQAAVQRIFQGITAAITNKLEHVHLLFHSSGGYVGDGVCLYNFFRSLTIELTLYNVGNVDSAAAIAYLGAQHRKTSAYASFLIHRSHNSPQAATAGRLEATAQSLTLDDQRTEAILRNHVTLDMDRWSRLDHYDIRFSAKEAVDAGLADEVAEFAPPPGSLIYTV